MSDIDFAALIEPVARQLWGEPPKGYVTKLSIRWGNNGSKSINLQTGEWYDHEAAEGGGVLDLIMRETGADKAGAMQWLEDKGLIEPRAGSEPRQEARQQAPAPEAPPDDDRPPAGSADDGKKVMVEAYDYVDRDGERMYQVVRYQWKKADGSWVLGKSGNPKKTFAQRRKDPSGEVVWNLDGIGHTIYRHNLIEAAIAEGKTILMPEGEKDVHTLEAWNAVATTNSGGAANWKPHLAEYFRGADVVILGDDDEPGRARVETIAMSLRGIARRIRVVAEWGGPKDVTDWANMAGSAELLHSIIEHTPDWRPTPPAPKFGSRRGQDIAGSKIVYDWLVKGLIERGGVFIVAGEKQAGKSFFVLDLAMKIVLGLDYGRGEKSRKVKQGAVVYMACEDRKGVDMRYEGYRRENGIEADRDVPFIIMGGAGGDKFSLMSDESVDAFIAHCLEWKAFYGSLEMVVIDTFSVATEGLDEIHSGEVGKVLGRVNRIADKTGSAVCLVHHMNGEGSRVRGHSSLTANVSQVIEIRNLTKPQMNRRQLPEIIRDADNRIIHQAILEKNKNGPNRIKWRFVLRQVKLGVDEDGFEITTCVLDAPSSEPDDGQIKTGRLSESQKLVYDALKEAIEDHGMDMPAGTRVGPQVRRAVLYTHWLDAVRKKWTFRNPEDKPEERSKELNAAMARIGTALLNGDYMGRDNDQKIVWSYNKDDRPKPASKPTERPAPTLTPEDAKALTEVPF